MKSAKLDKSQIRLLGLSPAEVKVLEALRAGYATPLEIARHTNVSRPAVYEILDRLHARRIVTSYIRGGKKYWMQAKEKDLEEELYETKKALFDIEEGVEEVHGVSDSTVIVHRGAEAIRALIHRITKENKRKRLYGVQGDGVVPDWEKIFGVEKTNELNRLIKQNEIISELVVPEGWFERQARTLGESWARDFEGRAAVTHSADPTYFDHGGQILMMKHSLFLIAMNEEIVIEVRNSEIQKVVLSLFRFMQDHSRKIDVNALLRKLLEKEES